MAQRINFRDFGGPTYVGRSKGVAARKAIRLDQLEDTEDVIQVDVPENTFSINSSFFLGLFGPSVRKCGSRDSFLEKFRFELHGREYEAIERGIERALLRNESLFD